MAQGNELRVDLLRSAAFTSFVRAVLLMICGGALLASGCRSHRGGSASFSDVPKGSSSSTTLPGNKLIMTPDTSLRGKVARVNLEGRFVIMTFPIGHLPRLEQRLDVYRGGLKVGEIRVTGPQLDDSVVGDIAAGDAQSGDEIRAQ
jgi:hypothetical protein